MSSMSSLYMAASSLGSQQVGLETVAHNLANVNTKGYVRQMVTYKDTTYVNIGINAISTKQVGLGTSVEQIKQVRDMFLDNSYRTETSRYSFYKAQSETITEIEDIFGEIEGETFSDILNNLWASMSEMGKTTEGLETRGLFLQSASLFIDRVNLISTQLENYQTNMNAEVKEIVDRVNVIGQNLVDLNLKISGAEINGAHANDLRDQRNLLLDELAEYGDIVYKEDALGKVAVLFEGVQFVDDNDYMEMGLTQATEQSPMVKPIWVSYGTDVIHLDRAIGPETGNDTGRLKGLLLARGTGRADYTSMSDVAEYNQYVKPSVIMDIRAKFDNLVHEVATTINDIMAPNTGTPPRLDTANAPYALDGTQGHEVFKRIYYDRYDAAGNYIEEDPDNSYTLYASGNLMLNPKMMQDYNLVCINKDPESIGDATIVENILATWQEEELMLDPNGEARLNFTDYYNGMIYEVGQRGREAEDINNTEDMLITQIDNMRQMTAGVSSDEELSNMMKYQHAYNAGARLMTVLSEMIEHIINNLGQR